MHALRTWSRRRLLIGALALALLFMQALGLAHGVMHGGLSQNAQAAAMQDDVAGDPTNKDGRLFDASHSCAAFHALTLAFALAVSGLAALLLCRSRAPAAWLFIPRRDAPPPRPFHSRAPPALLLA